MALDRSSDDPFPKKVMAVLCSDGKLFPLEEEVAALRHELSVTGARLIESRKKERTDRDDGPASGYGSSGGGGHD